MVKLKKYTERLRELREDRDLSQREIAELLNCTQTAYGKWENGKRDIKIDDLIKLATYYHVSMDYITGLTNDPEPRWSTKSRVNNSFNNNSGTFGNINIK